MEPYAAQVAASPIANRLAKGVLWSLVGVLATRAIALVTTIVVARVLGKVIYGEMGMILSTTGMLGTFAGLGLGGTATKFCAQFRDTDPQKVGRIISLLYTTGIVSGLVVLLGCLASASWIANYVLGRGDLAPYLRMSSVLLIISAIDGTQSGVLAGFEAFGALARRSIYQAILALMVTIPLVWSWGLHGAILSQIATALLSVIVLWTAVRQQIRAKGIVLQMDRGMLQEWPILWTYALPATGASLLGAPVTWQANVLLVNQPGGFGALGAVNVTTTLRALLMQLPTVMLAPTFTVMANSLDKPSVLQKLVRYCLTISSLARLLPFFERFA